MAAFDNFDNGAFSVSLVEARAMDPQQRLLLEECYTALHLSGLSRHSLFESLTAVFIGISLMDFDGLLRSSPLGSTVYAATGNGHSVASGRLSYSLGMHGPCLSVDTACSAALAACHMASSSLMHKECTDALASGVNLILSPVVSSRFALAGMTSPRGFCHTFDSRADG